MADSAPTALVPCLVCRRHAWSGEAACPFCGGTLAAAPASPPAPALRLTRAAILAGAFAVAGCGPEPVAPVYGGPPEPVDTAPGVEPEAPPRVEPKVGPNVQPDVQPSAAPSTTSSAPPAPTVPVAAYGAPSP
jgi:hypothetical protein